MPGCFFPLMLADKSLLSHIPQQVCAEQLFFGPVMAHVCSTYTPATAAVK